jgi:hypothetical protein
MQSVGITAVSVLSLTQAHDNILHFTTLKYYVANKLHSFVMFTLRNILKL